jgi:threonine/homoserine/homoserine lactone efflux protein
MENTTWLLFLAFSVAAVLTPGPAMLAIFGHALVRGGRATLPVVLGNAAGAVLLIALSVAGLSAVLATVPHGLIVLKWTGAGYLVLLGIAALRRTAPTTVTAARGGFIRGVLIALSNPKALLFFAAVLPQFVDPQRPVLPQFAILASTFAALELVTTTAVTFAAQGLSPILQKARVVRSIHRVGGVVLIGAAAILALAPAKP